jgi:hypothetical protein
MGRRVRRDGTLSPDHRHRSSSIRSATATPIAIGVPPAGAAAPLRVPVASRPVGHAPAAAHALAVPRSVAALAGAGAGGPELSSSLPGLSTTLQPSPPPAPGPALPGSAVIKTHAALQPGVGGGGGSSGGGGPVAGGEVGPISAVPLLLLDPVERHTPRLVNPFSVCAFFFYPFKCTIYPTMCSAQNRDFATALRALPELCPGLHVLAISHLEVTSGIFIFVSLSHKTGGRKSGGTTNAKTWCSRWSSRRPSCSRGPSIF